MKLQILKDKDERKEVRYAALRGLENMSRSGASVRHLWRSVRPLLEVIEDKDDDSWVSNEADWALDRIWRRLAKYLAEQKLEKWSLAEGRFRGGLDRLFSPEDQPAQPEPVQSEEALERKTIEEALELYIDRRLKGSPEEQIARSYISGLAVRSFRRPKTCPKCGGEEFSFSMDHMCFRCEHCGTEIESEEYRVR